MKNNQLENIIEKNMVCIIVIQITEYLGKLTSYNQKIMLKMTKCY